MRRKLMLPVLIISLSVSACSLITPRRAATPTQPPAIPITTITPLVLQGITAPAPLESTRPAAALTPAPTATLDTSAPTPVPAGQPVEIKGAFKYTNDIITTYYVENEVHLTDMYGFVKRDKKWPIPITSQYIGFLKIDKENKTGVFDLDLPAAPTGKQVSVNPQGPDDPGVQIFAMEYAPNLTGGPYSEGDDPELGWPNYLASVRTDSGNNEEVTGGKLIVWSPDNQESFPSSFGADGLLFTSDDPVMKVPQGYSVIDLDQKPFKIIRDAHAEVTLYEPQDAAIKDFSKLFYQDAFDQMFQIVRKQYAFNGVQGKQPNWDQLYASLAPRVADASQKKDATAFYNVMRDFTLAFKDGHVGLDGGQVGQQVVGQEISGGFGFALRQLDDGRVMVVYVVDNSPAANAGMKVGAVVSQFNGKPIDEAIQAVKPPTGPRSMDSTLREEQVRYLTRGPMGASASVTFTNPGESAQTVHLQTVSERESLAATSPYRSFDPNGLPVDYIVASSGVGYVRINSNYDDLNLIIRLFTRALTKFKENNLQTLIIDLRVNSGGAPLGLAGFLDSKEITLGQLEYYSARTGKFEPEGVPQTFMPNEEQFHFDKMYLLVGAACASACELEAYGFSQVPGMVVIGETSTSGTEAEVSRGQFKLPEGMSLQIPTGRFVLPDGSIFLEGKGVQPTVRVPVDEQNVLSSQDPVIGKALTLASQ